MKVYKTSQKELNERLELDKRQNGRAFCICFKSLEEAPKEFYALQDKIRNGLQREFWLNFDNGADGLRRKPWDSKNSFFNTDMFGAELIIVDISQEILGDKLIGLVMSYLEKCPSRYCVVASVLESMERGANDIGRGSSMFVMGINNMVSPVCQLQSRAWLFDTRKNDSRELYVWSRRIDC